MKKVLFIIENLESGGAQKFLLKLCNLFKNNIKIHILCLSKEQKNRIKINDNFDINYLINKKNSYKSNIIIRIFKNINRIRLIRKYLKKNNFDMNISFIANTNILFIISSIGLDIKKIICERNDPAKQSLGYIRNKLRILFYNRADLVTYNSKGAYLNLVKYIDKSKLYYTPNFTSSNNNNFSYKLKNQIIAVGRLEYQKNYDFMIKVFKVIMLHNPKLKLVILGDGSKKAHLLNLIQNLKLTKKINLVGHKDNLSYYYKNSDLLLMTSFYEGMPNVVLEAMSYGLPCLISNSFSKNISFYENYSKQLVYQENNSNNLIEKINIYFNNELLRSDLGKASKHYINLHNDKSIRSWKRLFNL